MLRPRKDHIGRRFGWTCLVRGHEHEGRKAIIKQGTSTTRVASVDADGVVNGVSYCIASHQVLEIQPDVRNQKKRPLSHHAGRTFPTTVRVRGLEDGRRFYLVQAGAVETRVIEIGPDGKSVGDSFVVPSEYIHDPQETGEPGTERTTMSDRGEIVVPAMHRAAKGVTGRWMVEVELREEGWLVRPISPAGRRL